MARSGVAAKRLGQRRRLGATLALREVVRRQGAGIHGRPRSVSRTARTARSSVSTATRQWLVEAEDNPFMTDAARVAALELLNKAACVLDCSALDCVASIPVK